MDRPLVAFDTECATAHGPPHLIEIGAVRVRDGEAVEHFAELVRPEVPIDPETTAVHGLGDEDVRQADDAASVLARFFEWLGDDWMAAHRAEVDARVLAFEGARHGLALPAAPVIDTLRLARRRLPAAPDHKLTTLVDWLGIESDETHRALPDAVACWKVLEACAHRDPARAASGDGPEGTGAKSAATSADLSLEALLAEVGRPVTLPGEAPRTPRLAARLRGIEQACRDRASLELLYGSRDRGEAPVWLGVTPRLLFTQSGKGYLEGESARSGTLKTYRLDRVHKVRV